MSYPCGHPRTPENSSKVGIKNGVRCKICRSAIARRYARKHKNVKPENYKVFP